MRRPKKDNSTYSWLCTTMHHSNWGDDENIIIRKNPRSINILSFHPMYPSFQRSMKIEKVILS
jgi:hypothetical protein